MDNSHNRLFQIQEGPNQKTAEMRHILASTFLESQTTFPELHFVFPINLQKSGKHSTQMWITVPKFGRKMGKEFVLPDMKYGVPIYRTNPSIPPTDEIARKKRSPIGTGAKGFIINASGEVLGEGVALAYEVEEVDDERFVKLFLAGIKQATGLTRPGLLVFELVYASLRENPKQDRVMLSARTAGISKTTFYNGLRELLERGFLFRTPYDGTFFINIRYMFNGDRLAFVKAYHRRKTAKKHSPDQLTLDMPDDHRGDTQSPAAA